MAEAQGHNDKGWLTKLLPDWTHLDVVSFVNSSSLSVKDCEEILVQLRELAADGEILNEVASATEFISDLNLDTHLARSGAMLYNAFHVHKRPIRNWTTANIKAYVMGRRYMAKECETVIAAINDLECEGEDLVGVEKAEELMDDFNMKAKMSCRKLFNEITELKKVGRRGGGRGGAGGARRQPSAERVDKAPIAYGDSSIRSVKSHEVARGGAGGDGGGGGGNPSGWGAKVRGLFSGRGGGGGGGAQPQAQAQPRGHGGYGYYGQRDARQQAQIADSYMASSRADEARRGRFHQGSMRGERVFGGRDDGRRFDLSIIARNSKMEKLCGVHTSDKIWSIKVRIASELMGGSVELLTLRFMGDVLRDDHTLGAYGITNEYHTVMLTFKVVGGEHGGGQN